MFDLRQHWNEEGYIIVRGLYAPERAARLRQICERILEQCRLLEPASGKANGDPNATCMRHLNHPGYFKETPSEFLELMDAVADPAVLNVARAILGEEPLFRCTSLFFNPLPTGTSLDGNWHRDTQFTIPDLAEEKKFIAATRDSDSGVQMQIALAPTEDVEFVPGSHRRLDTPEEFQIRRADNAKNWRSNAMPGALRIRQEPGDAVLFNPIGLHRGRYHTDKLRRTFMLTFTKTSAPAFDYFSQQPWFLEPGHLRHLAAPTREFFEQFIAVFKSHWLAEPVPA